MGSGLGGDITLQPGGGGSAIPVSSGSINLNSTKININGPVTASGNISSSGNIIANGITTSGNISSSGDITVNDVFAKSMGFSRSFSDTAFATDDVDGAASAQDDQEMHFSKVTSDISHVSESAVKLTSKTLTDSGVMSDSGTFRGQGYCDFDYFADDYVGFSGTF